MNRKLCLVIAIFLALEQFSISQETDSAKKTMLQLAGSVLVTNNGISLIPTFSLGEPAVLFSLYLGKRRLSFEPELRFSLEGKPWSFLFWWRYKLVDKSRFRFIAGAHPALNFKTIPTLVNGDTIERIVTRRYLAAELSPNYRLGKNISVGIYYLYGRGIDKEAVRYTHFLTLNSNITNIRLPLQLYMRFTPQVYYLRQYKEDGYYFTSSLVLARERFPISIMSIVNQSIESNISGAEDFAWNVSLIYSFNKIYVEKY